jgi:hypothetical protein
MIGSLFEHFDEHIPRSRRRISTVHIGHSEGSDRRLPVPLVGLLADNTETR